MVVDSKGGEMDYGDGTGAFVNISKAKKVIESLIPLWPNPKQIK